MAIMPHSPILVDDSDVEVSGMLWVFYDLSHAQRHTRVHV